MENTFQIDQTLSVKDKCKVVFLIMHDFLNEKKITEAINYMFTFIDGVNSENDDYTQINLLKSILVITKNYPDDIIKNARLSVKNVYDKLEEKFNKKEP